MKVSFIIAVYNHTDYVKSSLISAFEQDYENIEFIISDDYSTDDSFTAINQIISLYNHKLNIKFHRNNKNLGITENFKKNIEISTGEIIIGGSGDDIYEANRVSLTVAAFKKNKKISAVFSNGYEIDKFNNKKGLIFKTKPVFSSSKNELYYKKTWIHGATASYKKEICEKFCQISFKNNFQEDSIMSFISCLYGEIKYISSPLVLYRLHDTNISSPRKMSSLIRVFLNKPNIYKSRIDFLLSNRLYNFLLLNNFIMLTLTNIYIFVNYINLLEPILRHKFKKIHID